MPESEAAQIAAVQQNIRNAFVRDEPAARGMQLSMGVAQLASDAVQPTALGLLSDAERERRGVSSKLASAVGVVQGTETSAAGESQ
jgi:hypothetical protein